MSNLSGDHGGNAGHVQPHFGVRTLHFAEDLVFMSEPCMYIRRMCTTYTSAHLSVFECLAKAEFLR